MKKINGNIIAEIQKKTEITQNEIGEAVPLWEMVHSVWGFLDLVNGDSKYTNYNAKIQESSHVFICDYIPLDIFAENARMIINGKMYDVLLIDNPMELNYQLEFYLKFVGGQNG